MRTRYRYDADLDAVVEIRSGSNYFVEPPQGPSLIRDDLGAGVNGIKHLPSGKMLDSKSAHYRENKARGLEHVGNETNFATQRTAPKFQEYGQMVKDARDQIAGDHNGTRAWLERENRKSGG